MQDDDDFPSIGSESFTQAKPAAASKNIKSMFEDSDEDIMKKVL